MAASGKKLYKNEAFTLIEVLISIIIFSWIIGITSNQIEPVSNQYIAVSNIGTQLTLVQKTNYYFVSLSKDSNYLKAGSHQIPIDEILSTKLIKTLKLDTTHNYSPDYIIGKFTTIDFQSQEKNWYVYRF